MKAAQVLQVLNTFYYQSYLISTRDQVGLALTRYRAGNLTDANWVLVNNLLNSTFGTSQAIVAAGIFDLSGSLAFYIASNSSNQYSDDLFPVQQDINISTAIDNNGIYIAGPLYNEFDSTYLTSMTLPVLTNSTIFVESETQAGYISLIFQTYSFRNIINDTTGLNANGMMYLVSAENRTINGKEELIVQPLLPATNKKTALVGPYTLEDVPAVKYALATRTPGSDLNSKIFGVHDRAVGYALCQAYSANWVVLISESHQEVYEPIHQLRNITLIAGGVTLVVCVLVIIFLVHWGVQPIYRLKQAAEQIALSFHGTNNSPQPAGGYEKEYPPTNKGSSLKSRVSFWKQKPAASETHSSTTENMTPTVSSTQSITNDKSSEYSPSTAINISSSSREDMSIQPSKAAKSVNSTIEESNDKLVVIIAVPSADKEISSPPPILLEKSESPLSSENRRMLVPTRVKIREYRYFTDELVSLQYSFNGMADELEKQYTHLEDMVRERTKELEAARVQAENANEAKSLFIANITHELRTPLNGILGMTAVSMTENDPNKVKRSLKVISKSGILLLNLLNDLLTFSKNQIGNIVIEEKEFMIDEVISQLTTVYIKQANEKRIALDYDVSPASSKNMILYGDFGRILHVLLNIISNCLKFAPENSKIQIRIQCLQEEGSLVTPYDSTNGQGIVSSSSKINTTSSSNIPASNNPFVGPVVEQSSDLESTNELILVATSSGARGLPAQLPPHSIKSRLNSSESLGISSSTTHSSIEQSQSNTSSQSQSKSSMQIFGEPRPCVFRFEVEDEGPGVDPSRMEQLFEPFVQGDQALSRRHGGAGLGLSICKQLVNLMGGVISLRNSSTGSSGLIVTVDLPLKQTRKLSSNHGYDLTHYRTSDAMSSRQNSVQSSESSFMHSTSDRRESISSLPSLTPIPIPGPVVGSNMNGMQKKAANEVSTGSYFDPRPKVHKRHTDSTLKTLKATSPITITAESAKTNLSTKSAPVKARILVAEDNIINQEIMKRMLGLEGIRDVDLAVNGEQAIARVEDAIRRGFHYDVVFMDIQMPSMDGLQATRIIRNQLGYTYPVVALTAFADEENAAQCLETGMDSFLEKPVMRDSLREVLVKYCDTEALNDELSLPMSNFESSLYTPPTPQ